MSKFKKTADEILKDHPGETKVIITQDGQAFFNDLAASHHHKRNGFKQDPEVFFRDGFEPEDTKELEEDLQLTKEANATLEDAIKLVMETTNLESDAPEVNGQTFEVVAKVVGLREKLQATQATLLEVAEAVTRACDLENEVPELTLNDEALPIVKAVIQLRAQFYELSNELATLKAKPIEVIEDSKDVKKTAAPATKK